MVHLGVLYTLSYMEALRKQLKKKKNMGKNKVW